MPKIKTKFNPSDKSLPAPTDNKQPAAPEKKGGPLPSAPAPKASHRPENTVAPTQAAEMLTGPKQGSGSKARASMMKTMQQTVGNARANRMLGTTERRAESAANATAVEEAQTEAPETPEMASLQEQSKQEEERAVQAQAQGVNGLAPQPKETPRQEIAARSALTPQTSNVEQANEKAVTTQQTIHFSREKADHVVHEVANETDASNNGHLAEWITESHTVEKKGADFVATINELDLHTQVYIWPEGTPGRWNDIADFGPHYNQPYDPAFNLYVGSFQAKYQASYWANGEVDGQHIEWEYYHREYEKHTAEMLTYGLFDWAVTDEDAHNVLEVLHGLEARDPAAFERMVKHLEGQGLLDRLLDNISAADKKTYKSLIAKVYLLL